MRSDPQSPNKGAHQSPTSELRRRGLLAAMAGLAAGTLAKVTATPAFAGTDGDVVLGGSNTTGGTTQINATGAASAFVGNATGSGFGGQFLSGGPTALQSGTPSFSGTAIAAFTDSSFGVFAIANSGEGLRGSSNNGAGVHGSTGGVGKTGVLGETGAANAFAVFGEASGISGTGVQGRSLQGTGVVGSSTTGTGVAAVSTNGVGLTAQSSAESALTAFSSAGNRYAGNIQNLNGALGLGLFVNGSLAVSGTKSSTVRIPDGTYRKLYAVEAPENWFEDYGTGTLVGGRATIQLEPVFRQTIDTAQTYHVFLTPHSADIESLAVTARRADQFVVEANGKGNVDGTFSYRILAKRQGIAPGLRLEVDHASLGAISDAKPIDPPAFTLPTEPAVVPKYSPPPSGR